MAMKRRGFLAMLGAAIGSPLMPAAGVATPAAGASKTAFELAVAHARTFPVISVAGLSKHANLSPAQADALIKRLGAEGMVKLIRPARSGAVRAASKVFTNDALVLARAAQARRTAAAKPKAAAQPAVGTGRTVAPWLAHLHDLCRQQGMTLSDRCFA